MGTNFLHRHWGAQGTKCIIALFILTAASFLIAAMLVPTAWVASVVFLSSNMLRDLGLSAYGVGLLAKTLALNLTIALFATALAIPAALVIGRGRGALAAFFRVAVPAALLLPSLALDYGWLQAFRALEVSGFVPGLSFVPGETADVMRCIVTLAARMWPIPAIIIGMSLRRMDPTVEELAILDGVHGRTLLVRLRLPTITAIAIVLLLSTQDAAIYRPTGIAVVATEVEMVFATGAFSAAAIEHQGAIAPSQEARSAAAIATALPLLFITATIAVLMTLSSLRSPGTTLSRDPWPNVLSTRKWMKVTAVGLFLLGTGLPILALFAGLRRISTNPLSRFESGDIAAAAIGSLEISCLTALFGFLLALAGTLRRPGIALTIAIGSFLVGGRLVAIALIRLLNRPEFEWAYSSWVMPVVAYLASFGWIAIAAGYVTWRSSWLSLREMARLDGASGPQAAMGVVWPNAWPLLVLSGLLVGMLSLNEVPATTMLTPQNPPVLTSTLAAWSHKLNYSPMILASLVMIAFVVLFVGAVAFFSQRQARRAISSFAVEAPPSKDRLG